LRRERKGEKIPFSLRRRKEKEKRIHADPGKEKEEGKEIGRELTGFIRGKEEERKREGG